MIDGLSFAIRVAARPGTWILTEKYAILSHTLFTCVFMHSDFPCLKP